MARSAWLRWLTALATCCLVAGCLLHRPIDLGTPPQEPVEPPIFVGPVEPPAPPYPLSDYGLRPLLPVARSAGSGDAQVERVKLEMKPAPPATPPRELLADSPSSSDPPVVSALRQALKKHPEMAWQLLEKSDSSEHELLLALLRVAAGLGEREVEELSPDEVAALLARLGVLTQRLKERVGLTLGEVCFCRRIDSFGQYQRLPRTPQGHYEFQAGSDGLPGERIQVYAEVRNFNSVRREDRYFETRLTSSLAILDNSKGLVKSRARSPQPSDDLSRRIVYMKLGTCIDVSQTRRHDYFLNFQFHVPARLPPGLYTLRVTVEDETRSGPGQKPREVCGSLDFRVRPPGPR
jgi:hypothetical protein